MSKKILIAEDDMALRVLVFDILSDEGYEVDAVEDGLAAKIHLEQSQYDLVILDFMMPEMTGVEVCDWLRKTEDNNNRNVPVILLTAKAQEKDRELAKQVLVDAYIVKPFSPIHFIGVVEEMMSTRNGVQHGL